MTILLLLAIGFSGLSLTVHLVSHVMALGRLRLKPLIVSQATWPEVTLVRPLRGVEPFSEETLAASFQLTYPSYEILFCVAQETDPVVPLVRAAMQRHQHVRARLLIGEDARFQNPKLDNMAKGYREAQGAYVVFTDSNLLVPEDYLQRVIGAFTADAGVVSAPPFGAEPGTFAADVECAILNSYAARVQYCVDYLGFGFAQGKTLAFRKSDLDAGGFLAMDDEPAEDAAATKWARRNRRKVRLVRPAFPQPLGARSLNAVWSRHLRWARLRRATFPLLFAPEILSLSPVPLAAVAAATILSGAPSAPWMAAYALVWYGADYATSRLLGWPASLHRLLALPVRDFLLLAIWCGAWTGRSFTWHGHKMNASQAGG